jgi:hypothetical protein
VLHHPKTPITVYPKTLQITMTMSEILPSTSDEDIAVDKDGDEAIVDEIALAPRRTTSSTKDLAPPINMFSNRTSQR